MISISLDGNWEQRTTVSDILLQYETAINEKDLHLHVRIGSQ